MFPQTPHIECVAPFDREAAAYAGKRGFGVTAGLDPAVAKPLAARCAELGYCSMWSNDHPAARASRRWPTFAEGTDGLDLGVAVIALDRQRARGDRRRHRAARASRRQALARRRRGLHREAADDDARGAAGAARGAARRQARPRGDGPEDVRARRRQLRRRLLQLDDARLRHPGPRQVEFGAQEADRDAPPVFGYVRTAVGDDAVERLAKEESFYRDCTTATATTSTASRPEGTVGVAAEDADDAPSGPRRL